MTRGISPFTASPRRAFTSARVLQCVFTAAPVMFIVVGEMMRARVEDFMPDGFVALGAEIWAIRALLIAWSIVQLVLAHVYYTDERAIEGVVKRVGEANDAAVTQALLAAQTVRLAFSESVAIYGLTLYTFNAERADLYAFVAAGLIALMLVRPRQERWEAAFAWASTRFPSVSHSPWSSIPS